MSFNLRNVLKATLPEGNKLVEDVNLTQFDDIGNGASGTFDAANQIAKFEGSIPGGVDAFSRFSNVAVAEISTLKNNLKPIADKTIQAVTGNIDDVKRIIGVPQSNQLLNANNQVVNNSIDNIAAALGNEVFDANENLVRNEESEPIELAPVTVTGTPTKANPLERFVSANYVWTLSALSNEELADPDNTYLKNGPQVIILKSGGGSAGTGGKKVVTAMENGRTEYFIEDVTIESIISPNPKSSTTSYHKFTFRVVEPYSMGQFLEALEIGARRSGHQNYIGAPFMLSLDWVGYLQEPSSYLSTDFNAELGQVTRLSQMEGESGRHMPLMITNATFNVTTKGTEYNCTAIAYNGSALTDVVQKIPTDIAISGETVEKILQSGAQSLTTVINTALLKREKNDKRSFADEYVILFPVKESSASSPQTTTELNSAVSERDIDLAKAEELFFSGKMTEAQFNEIAEQSKQFSFEEWAKKILGVSLKRNRLSEALKADRVEQTNVNKIGKAKIVFDTLQDGATTPPPQTLVYNGGKKVNETANVQIPKNTRELKFKKDTKLNKIVEEVILGSEYGRGLMDRATKESGAKEWFRIETQVFNIPVAEVEAKRGRPPKIYVYRVVPYDVNVSLIEKPSEIMPGEDDIRNHVVKDYHYMYTGMNKDIIDLEINFENRFLTPVSPDLGSNQADVVDQGAFATSEKQDGNSEQLKVKDGSQGNIAGAIPKIGSVSLVNPTASTRGVPGNEKEDIARSFHNALINHTVDLMQMKLKIWGDPYYISDSGMGNYNSAGAGKGGKAMIDERGQMVYKQKQVYITIDFRTPIDYGDDGLAEFNQPIDNALKGSKNLEKFSGLYWVTMCESSFSGGRFEQTLTLLRQRNQAAQARLVKKADNNQDTGSTLETASVQVPASTSPILKGYTGGAGLGDTGAGSKFA